MRSEGRLGDYPGLPPRSLERLMNGIKADQGSIWIDRESVPCFFCTSLSTPEHLSTGYHELDSLGDHHHHLPRHIKCRHSPSRHMSQGITSRGSSEVQCPKQTCRLVSSCITLTPSA